MKRFLHRVWAWVCAIFISQKQIDAKIAEMLAEGVKEEARKKESARYQKKIDSRGSKFKRLRLRWRMLWSGTRGTYSRRTEKLGRNVPCPCGAMRVAPRDVTKRNKLKWCCK